MGFKGGEEEMNRPTSMDPPMKQDDVYLHFKKIHKCYAQHYRKVEIEMLGTCKFIFINGGTLSVLCVKLLHTHFYKTCTQAK